MISANSSRTAARSEVFTVPQHGQINTAMPSSERSVRQWENRQAVRTWVASME